MCVIISTRKSTRERSAVMYKKSEGLEFAVDVTVSYCLVKGIGSCKDTELVIPSEHNGLPVVGIAKNAFLGCESIKKIILSEGLRMICPGAFCSCRCVTEVCLPNSLISIGYMAFCGCTALENINIPKSVDRIGGYALKDCFHLLGISYGGTIDEWLEIGVEYSFDENTDTYTLYCSDGKLGKLSQRSLLLERMRKIAHYKTVEYADRPKSDGIEYTPSDDGESLYVTGIGSCTDTEIYIPAAVNGKPVTRIEKKAFKSCESITSVSIPFGVELIGGSAFNGCKSLVSVEIPESVHIIENAAFIDCKALASITLPSIVSRVAPHTFMGCSSLSRVRLPDSIESIGMYAFKGCVSLGSVELPCNVSYIGMDAFEKSKHPKLSYPKSELDWLFDVKSDDDLTQYVKFKK